MSRILAGKGLVGCAVLVGAGVLAGCGGGHSGTKLGGALGTGTSVGRPGSSGGGSVPGGPAGSPGSSVAPFTPSVTVASWHLPEPVSRPIVVSNGNGFVILGGLATGDTSTDRIVSVDPSAGSAQLTGTLAVAVHDSAGGLINGAFFTFGGGSFSNISTVQQWRGGGVAATVGALPTPRSDLVAVGDGTTTYVLGGFNGSSPNPALDPSVLATTDGTTFRQVGQLAVPVRYPAVALSGGSIWIFGGVTGTSDGSTTDTDAIQRLDLSTGQDTVVGHLPQPLGHAGAFALDGQVFLAGGRSGTVPSSVVYRLDPSSGGVTQVASLPSAQSDFGSVVVNGVAYLVGGETTGPAAPLSTVIEVGKG